MVYRVEIYSVSKVFANVILACETKGNMGYDILHHTLHGTPHNDYTIPLRCLSIDRVTKTWSFSEISSIF